MNELPEGWIKTAIDNVTTDAQQRQPQPQEEFVYIDISSINRESKKIQEPQKLKGENAPTRARKVVASDDVLVSMTRPNLNAVALVPPELDGQIASTGLDVLRAANMDPRWLFYFVRSHAFVSTMSDLVQGALYPAIRSKDIRNSEIPLAPLAEQKRIADKLDALLARVDRARTRLDRVPLILKRFRQAVLSAATSGQLTEDWREENEEMEIWHTTDIQSIAKIGTGSTPLRSNPNFYASIGTPWITSAATGYPFITSAQEFITDEAIACHRLKRYPVGTILVAMYGEGKTRGQVSELAIEATINQACAAIIADQDRVSKNYLKLTLQAYYLEMRELAEGGNQPNLNLNKIKEFVVPLPPLPEQHEIVRRVETLFAFADRLQARYQAARSQVDQLNPALLAQAFRGELVPQDPNDEPAALLLERIRKNLGK